MTNLAGKSNRPKLRKDLPSKTQEEIYFKTVGNAVTCCKKVWGISSPAILSAVDALHAGAAKLVHKLEGTRSTEEILNKARWQTINYIYKNRVLTLMQRIYYET